MLGDIGIGGFDFIPEFSDSHFSVLEETEDLQADGMSHGLQQTRNFIHIVVVHNCTIAQEGSGLMREYDKTRTKSGHNQLYPSAQEYFILS